jgi:hypothetical protein
MARGAIRLVRIIIRQLNQNTHRVAGEARGLTGTQRRPSGLGGHCPLTLLYAFHRAKETVTGRAVDGIVAHLSELDLGLVVAVRLTAGLVRGRKLVN